MKIPVTYTHNNKLYHGHLSEVNGAAAKLWHLEVEGYYKGQLVLTERGFSFYFQKEGYHKELSEEFGDVVIAWYG